MPLTERKPDAVAHNYARALFEVAHAAGGGPAAEAIGGQLEDILELARADKSFGEFLASRVIATKARRGAIERMLKGRADDLLVNFLLLLNDRDRLGDLPAIARAYDQQVQQAFGRVEVDVFTAEPVGADTLRSIGDRLGTVLGKQVVTHPYTDPSMIGGVKFRIGDQLIDASVSRRLQKMREKIERDGGSALKARFDSIIDDRAN